MKRFYLISALFAASLLAAQASFAQSTNRDDPTPLTSNEVSGNFDDPERGAKEYFYSFTAGPGDLTITFDLKGRDRDASGSVAYELLPSNGSEGDPILCCEYAQTGGGTTGRSVANVKLTRRQNVILHLTNSIYRGGSFNVRFSGAPISFGGAAAGRGDGGNTGEDRGRGEGYGHGNNHGGDPVEVPASGILHIRMKDGTVRDIDLSRVRSITVKP